MASELFGAATLLLGEPHDRASRICSSATAMFPWIYIIYIQCANVALLLHYICEMGPDNGVFGVARAWKTNVISTHISRANRQFSLAAVIIPYRRAYHISHCVFVMMAARLANENDDFIAQPFLPYMRAGFSSHCKLFVASQMQFNRSGGLITTPPDGRWRDDGDRDTLNKAENCWPNYVWPISLSMMIIGPIVCCIRAPASPSPGSCSCCVTVSSRGE